MKKELKNIAIPSPLHERLRIEAANKRVTIQDLTVKAIEQALSATKLEKIKITKSY